MAVVLLTSCADDDTGLKLSPIDSKIIVELRETLSPASRSLGFFCRTEKIYPCANFPLTAEQRFGDRIEITFTTVAKPEICLTALGPATTVIDFDTPQKGSYGIDLNNDRLMNSGTLTVSDTSLTLLFHNAHGIEIARTTTMRVPPHTYWGYIGYHTASSSTQVGEFLGKFADRGAMFNKQRPGHYVYYEIDDFGDIVANAEGSGHYFLKRYIFQYHGDEAALRDLIRTDGRDLRGEMYILLETYRGERINNWSD